MSDRTKIFIGQVGIMPASLSAFKQAVGDAQKIELVINSIGGSMMLAFEMVDHLKGRDVTAVITERCFSAAGVLMLAAQHITMLENAELMLHEPHIPALNGTVGRLRADADKLEAAMNRYAQMLADRTELPASICLGWMKGPTDRYLSAHEAKALCLIDEIIPKGKPEPVSNLTDSESLFFELLGLFPRIETRNRAAFYRNLQSFLTHNLHVCSHPAPSEQSGIDSRLGVPADGVSISK